MITYSINTLHLIELGRLGLLKHFGRFLYYRSFFKKGCIHNYTDTNLARRIKCSVSKARSLRLFWMKNDWCRFEGNKMVFNSSRNSVRGAKWHKSTVEIYNCINKTINELYYKVLKNKNNQFEFLKQLAVAITNPSNIKQHKWGKSKLRKLGSDRLPKTSDRFKISYKGLGKLFGCSSSKAYGLINGFEEENRLSGIRSVVRVFCGERPALNRFVAKHTPNGFVGGNYVYKTLCNEYIFS